MFNKKTFFDNVRGTLFGGSLSAGQVAGLNRHLDYFANHWADKRLEMLGYALATTYHECDKRMESIKEYGSEDRFRRLYDIEGARPKKAIELGNDVPGDGALYCARGCSGVTGKSNYLRQGQKHGVDLVANPDLLLKDQTLSVAVHFEAMFDGDYTGLSLSDCFDEAGDFDAVKARRIINGTDKAQLISAYYDHFMRALQASTVKEMAAELREEKISAQAYRDKVNAEFDQRQTIMDDSPVFNWEKSTPEPVHQPDADVAPAPSVKKWHESKITRIAALLLGGAVSTLAAKHGYNVPADVLVDLLAGGTTISAVGIGIARTWFTKQTINGLK